MADQISIGMPAPQFVATSTMGEVRLIDYAGKWLIFFSHPGDFTPVCTTEFIAFQNAQPQFAARNAELMGLSIDSNPSHLAWIQSIYQMTGIQINFPIIADRTGELAQLYGMVSPYVSKEKTIRDVFIIGPDQRIRAILSYPLTNGRNIPEILRLLIALQTTDAYNVYTPANWQPGQPVIVPPPQTYPELLARQSSSKTSGLSCQDWFLCFENDPGAASQT